MGRAGSASTPSGSAAEHARSWFPSNSFKFLKSSNYVMVLELLRPRAVEVPIKGMKQEFQLKKVPQKNSRGPELAEDTSHA